MDIQRKRIFICLSVLLFVVLACDFNLGGLGGPSEAEQTLQAIYLQQTVEAIEQTADTAQEVVGGEATATIEIKHTTIPDQPGWVSQYWIETNSASTAGQKRANGGDYLNQNLLERPFTAGEMVYRPDVDLVRVEISQDQTFYYFMLHLSGVNSETNMLSAYYGVELDISRDGRGDLLLWALGDGSTEWRITDVFVYQDANDDVGGSRPLLAEAPNYNGDSYEKLLFSPDHLNDPDAAWKRVDPADAKVIQLAIKKSVLGNATAFMWNAWADDGVKDPTRFDYNDFFTLTEAGSPIGGASDYPLKDLYLVDNTCRLAYGFEPTGNETGLCYVPEPAATPEPPEPEPDEPELPCDCASFENYTFITDAACCTYCGYEWGGTTEFPCYQPGPEPPCDCDSFPNQTFMTDAACCTYCGYSWSDTEGIDFPCY